MAIGMHFDVSAINKPSSSIGLDPEEFGGIHQHNLEQYEAGLASLE